MVPAVVRSLPVDVFAVAIRGRDSDLIRFLRVKFP
jgi:hypothetical protein